VGIDELRVHPRHLVTEETALVLRLWREWRGGELGGGRLSPLDLMELPLMLLDAFAILDRAWSRIRPKPRDGRG